MKSNLILPLLLIFFPLISFASDIHYNFDLKGMMCRKSCVPTVEKAVSAISNVKKVEVDFDKEKVDFHASSEVLREEVVTALAPYGEYIVGEYRDLGDR